MTKDYIPETKLFSEASLTTLFEHYSTIFFKPEDGSGGAKIVKITRKNGRFKTKYKNTVNEFTSLTHLYRWLKQFAGKRKFILQKGILLAKTNGRPFDIRVMVQKNSKGIWSTTAIFCKVGKPGKVATNYNQGGQLKYLNAALEGAGYSQTEIKATRQQLSQLGLDVAKVFTLHSKGFKELGLDVAIDQNKKLWILEVNTRPQFYPLRNFKDKSLYNKIASYAKTYGRYN